jgi:hypothetical protein
LTHSYTHILSGRPLVALLLLFCVEAARALISGSGPSPRAGMGFATMPDGMLYVFGGSDAFGDEREGGGGGQPIRYMHMYIYIMCIYI